MKIDDLIGDLISEPPEIRHDSPPVRHAETRMDKGDSPLSPLSPAASVRFVAGHWTVSLEYPAQLERHDESGDLAELIVCPSAVEANRLLATISGRAWYPACASCRHLRRPGLADGYCGARSDLPPAYGPQHPLRRLPADAGRTCDTWEPMQ